MIGFGKKMKNNKIRIFTCGGTIDKIYFDANNEFQVGEPQIATVLRESNVSIDFEVNSVIQKDSLDMTDSDRQAIRNAIEAVQEQFILLTHGTDTMVETAKTLLPIKDKTIVLTGSMAPARFKVTDAVFNIGAAVCAVQTLPAGVYIVMHGQVFNPEEVTKNKELNRFVVV